VSLERPLAVYLRVSTRKQETENQSIAIEGWLSSRGLSWGDVDYRLEDVESGTEDQRSGFQELWRLVKEGRVHGVLVFEISRLSRRQRTLIDFLYDCVERGITVYSVKESYLAEWLREPRARAIVVGLLSILYDLERQMISDRTKAGLERARMQGKVVGRPRKQVDRREVDKLLKLGVPRTKIARMLGVSPRTLKRRIVEWSSQGRA
jgi:DNA invertase Pin-like site-specific DNA recombinase